MKMFYGSTPIKSLNIKHYEIDTNSCDMIASDLQAGKTAVARGKKITGTGKSFEFAIYGESSSNVSYPLPSAINTVQVSSIVCPVRQLLKFDEVRITNFTNVQTIAEAIVDGVNYPINIQVANNILTLTCDLEIKIQLFYGKDNYT